MEHFPADGYGLGRTRANFFSVTGAACFSQTTYPKFRFFNDTRLDRIWAMGIPPLGPIWFALHNRKQERSIRVNSNDSISVDFAYQSQQRHWSRLGKVQSWDKFEWQKEIMQIVYPRFRVWSDDRRMAPFTTAILPASPRAFVLQLQFWNLQLEISSKRFSKQTTLLTSY